MERERQSMVENYKDGQRDKEIFRLKMKSRKMQKTRKRVRDNAHLMSKVK